ncbi:HpcH-HpaI domain-containing protein [Fusarium falciforme]|uniref:HpcH-HpaI domain-containing protein n=1 Tax=Fusarium falciforme TaxID=195108 RepID=UPI002300BD82|nr:HpcH-HpaI domain-containing protein [Fusarium falciforme]WAO94301.1 HpcH-HpaI domain-containing protein [Fusarium falciforme]
MIGYQALLFYVLSLVQHLCLLPPASAGVLIDAEHGLISDKDYYELTNAVASEGASPIIRVPWNEEWMIKRALDAGCHGVLTLMCHSADDARKIVQYSKYSPVGSRGYGPMFAPHSFHRLPARQYDERANKDLLVAAQIEFRSAVENVDEIAQVEVVDVLLIGPFDLAKQMGVTRGSEEHAAAIQKALKAAKLAGKKTAIFCTNGTQARSRAQEGFYMVSIITGLGILEEGMTRELAVATNAHPQEKGRDQY